MKKIIKTLVAGTLVVCTVSLCACSEQNTVEDHVKPVISGLTTVNLKLTNATFDVYNGVSVSDTDDEGNVFDLTSSLQVVAPADLTITEGKVEFNQAGDYNFTYYVKDSAGNLTVENRKVTVVKTSKLSFSGLDNVKINNITEYFDMYDGVTVLDTDEGGNTVTSTLAFDVIVPVNVTVTDGKVKFEKAGDYNFTYYVKDESGNLAIENRKVTVINSANLFFSGLNTVMVDKETEFFDIYDGVSVSYDGNDGNLPDSLLTPNVIAPADVTIINGKVKFNKTGDYNFTYYANDEDGNIVVNNRKVEVRNIYNCYWVNATMPVLYCALDMVSNDYKSMLVFTRSDTLNISEMDDNRFIYKVNGADVVELDKAKKYMARIAKIDEHSYFRAFICDAFNQIELFSFVQYGIPASRYEVKLVSDGSWTYNTAFPYRDANSWELWKSNSELYKGIRQQAFLNEYIESNSISGVQQYKLEYENIVVGSHYYNDAQLSTMAIMAAQNSNIEMWCAYPETLKSANAQVQAEIDKAHMPKMAPDAMYAKLSSEQKQKFLKICNLDKDSFDKEYFNKEGDYLIITGTNPFTGGFSDEEFADILNRIVKDYNGYNILYKPHPSALAPGDSMPETKAVLEKNGIKIMPGRLPMEVITWVYNDVRIGGFDSSLFMAVPQGNTEFFIAQGVDSLSVLSKQLYNSGAFGTPKFYWKAS